jgi:hypothetical protein
LQVLADSDPSKEERLDAHAKAWPLEATPIADSANSFGGRTRTPHPSQTFIPVGHISLNAGSENFNFESSYQIAFFYVSTALQGGGLGRSAMDEVEHMGTSEPLCAKSLWLCATSNIQQDPVSQSKKAQATVWTSVLFSGCLLICDCRYPLKIGTRGEAIKSFRTRLVNG